MKVYIQQKENECGLYIIKSLYEYYHNLKKDINNLREQVSISKKGISVYDLLSLAKQNYIDLTPFQAKAKDVLSNKNEYFIVGFKNIKYHHYVIIEIKKDYVSVFDPAMGKYKLLFEEFEKLYNQLVITIKPKKLLIKKAAKAKMKMISFIFKNMRIIFMSLILIFVIIVISFLSTFFMKIVFDNIIPSQALNLLGLVSILFISITIVRIFITYFLYKIISIFKLSF